MAVHPKRPDLKVQKPATPARTRDSYPSLRSWTMSRIRSKDTKPEVAVRRAAHKLGLRFRLHRRDLPGTPDLVFPSRQTAVFVHGCFWHRHGCARATLPATNVPYWTAKFDRNVQRDARNAKELRKLGWRCVRIWECEAKEPQKLAGILKRRVVAKPFGARLTIRIARTSALQRAKGASAGRLAANLKALSGRRSRSNVSTKNNGLPSGAMPNICTDAGSSRHKG